MKDQQCNVATLAESSPVKTVTVTSAPLLPDFDVLPHRPVPTTPTEYQSSHYYQRIRSDSRYIGKNPIELEVLIPKTDVREQRCRLHQHELSNPSPRFKKQSKGKKEGKRGNPRTGIKVRNDETLARHPTGLVHEHVGALVVRVVGDEEAGRLGVVRVEGFDDLGGLRGQLWFTRLQQAEMQGCYESSTLDSPLIRVRHTCPGTDNMIN